MQIRDVELRGIPAVTKSGEKLGKLTAFVIDTEHHEVAQYVISSSGLLAALLPDELLVHRSQVVSLDADLLVVDDGVIAEKSESKAKPVPGTANPTPAMRVEELFSPQKNPMQ